MEDYVFPNLGNSGFPGMTSLVWSRKPVLISTIVNSHKDIKQRSAPAALASSPESVFSEDTFLGSTSGSSSPLGLGFAIKRPTRSRGSQVSAEDKLEISSGSDVSPTPESPGLARTDQDLIFNNFQAENDFKWENIIAAKNSKHKLEIESLNAQHDRQLTAIEENNQRALQSVEEKFTKDLATIKANYEDSKERSGTAERKLALALEKTAEKDTLLKSKEESCQKSESVARHLTAHHQKLCKGGVSCVKQMEELRVIIDDQGRTLWGLHADHDKESEDYRRCSHRNADLQKQVDEAENKIREGRSYVSQLEQRLKEAVTEQEKDNELIRASSERVRRLEAFRKRDEEIVSLTEQVRQMKEENMAMQGLHNDLHGYLGTLDEKYSSMVNEKNNQLNGKNNEISQLRIQKDQASANRDQVANTANRRLDDLRKQIRDANAQVQQLKAAIHGERQQNRDTVSGLQSQVQKADSALSEQRGYVEFFCNRADRLQNERDHVRNERDLLRGNWDNWVPQYQQLGVDLFRRMEIFEGILRENGMVFDDPASRTLITRVVQLLGPHDIASNASSSMAGNVAGKVDSQYLYGDGDGLFGRQDHPKENPGHRYAAFPEENRSPPSHTTFKFRNASNQHAFSTPFAGPSSAFTTGFAHPQHENSNREAASQPTKEPENSQPYNARRQQYIAAIEAQVGGKLGIDSDATDTGVQTKPSQAAGDHVTPDKAGGTTGIRREDWQDGSADLRRILRKGKGPVVPVLDDGTRGCGGFSNENTERRRARVEFNRFEQVLHGQDGHRRGWKPCNAAGAGRYS